MPCITENEWLPDSTITDAVAVAGRTEIVQLVVLSDADTPVIYVICPVAIPAVEEQKTAVDAEKTTSIRYHAVPSFATAQSLFPAAVDVTGKNRLVALTVFGVDVRFLNVTVFAVPIDHAPV